MARPALLTTHAHVLISLASGHEIRLRDIARRLDMTDRAIQLVVNDLVEAGYVTRHRIGRRNYYELHPDLGSGHPLEQQLSIGDLVATATDRRPASLSPPARGAGRGSAA